MRDLKTHVRQFAVVLALCLAQLTSIAIADKQSGKSSIPSCFVLSSSEAEAAVREGLMAAKEGKTAAVLLEDVRRQPSWTAKRKGPARGCSVWFTSLGGAYLRLRGLRSWEESKDDNVIDLLPKDGSKIDHLDFAILLKSAPQNGKGTSDDTEDSADVRVVRFEISDDRGNKTAIMPGPAPNLRPEDLDNSRSQDPDSFGGLKSHQRDEVLYTLPSQQFTPLSVRPYLESRYMISTPILDARGQPRIAPDAREIRLMIVTRSGKMQVRYALPARLTTNDIDTSRITCLEPFHD